ncbi:uncharacterized protein BCR38DRAFT_165638 [Pseudomassariella vexata]|uniref:Uncharacterized protein n=1 Tax=Pseudomassariella vexata TaxID=1141098 RepID=A0A1Y2E2J8_9PEZI|nr:uncharacterized protein BCR38DRAFT_165638 [Pseudomassariella vexata]ORY65770.1 hypothetical protein BCR38DRAFT_165638 [Pseudomassariella vexata]
MVRDKGYVSVISFLLGCMEADNWCTVRCHYRSMLRPAWFCVWPDSGRILQRRKIHKTKVCGIQWLGPRDDTQVATGKGRTSGTSFKMLVTLRIGVSAKMAYVCILLIVSHWR